MPNITDYLDEGTLLIVGRRADGYYLIADKKAMKNDPKALAVLVDTEESILWPPQYLQAIIKFNDWEEVENDPVLLEKFLKLPWAKKDIPGVEFTWESVKDK